MLDEMKIIGDFILCKDVTEEFNAGSKLFIATPEDNRMSSDNLHIFEVVKIPEKGIDINTYFDLAPGDRIISISTGTDLRIDGKDYKLFDLKYITAKIRK